MKRIDGADRVPDLFGPGRAGFQEQVPGVSLATQLTAKWFNQVQESIVRTIEAAGLALSEADMDQFVAALDVLDERARDAAITAAELDATTKANAARTEAIFAAATDASGKANAARLAAADDATTKANAVIPSGTRMLFQQSSAPVGWTKVVDHNDKTLRVVNGAAGSGGTLNFTSVFVNGHVGDHTLTIEQIPAHGGHIGTKGTGDIEDAQSNPNFPSESRGGGQPHNHTINLDVLYVDVIIARKN